MGEAQNDRADGYFRSVHDQFRRAAARDAVVVQHLIVAGQPIQIEVAAGATAQAILPALAHLVVPAGAEPALTVSVWDSETTGTAPIRPGWGLDDYGRDGFVSGFNDDRFHTAIQFDPTLFRMIDMVRRRALYWTPDARLTPYWEVGAPLRPLLHEWLRRTGLLALHGGAVGYADGGVLLAGAGGKGKSNSAVACLASDLMYASDDFCCASHSPAWTVHSLYSTAKIASSDLLRHPHLVGAASNIERFTDEKALFFLTQRFADRLIREMPLKAIVMPRVVGEGDTTLAPIAAAAAQKAIATSTIELSRWTAPYTFTKVAELVRALPCYEMRIGANIADVPIRIGELLRSLR